MGEIRGKRAPNGDPLLLKPEVPILLRPGERIQFGLAADRCLILPLSKGISPGPVFQSLLAAQRGQCLVRNLQSHSLAADFIEALVADLHDAQLVVEPTISRTITIIGRDSLRTRIHETLRHDRENMKVTARAPSRHTLQWLSTTPLANIGLVLVTGMEVPDLHLTRILINRGVPHLSAQFRDGLLVIGPYFVPRASPPTPCSVCVENHRTDLDSARTTLALQMRTYVPHTAPQWVAPAASVVVSKLRHSELGEFIGAEVSIDFSQLEITRKEFQPHPRCSVCGYQHRVH